MLKLFDEIFRNNNDPAEHNENEYDYINNNSREIIVEARKKLGDWFDDYPNKEKRELKNRFKKDFNSSFYELYLFSLFKRLDFDIQIHPKVPNSPKRPDFLLSRKDLEIYVEAKTVSNKSEAEKAEKRKLNQLFDEISKINLDKTLLLFEELQLKTNKQPSAKKIKNEIVEKISTFNLESLSRDLELGKISNLPKIIIDNEDIYLEIGLFAIKEEWNNSDKKRPIGSYPYESLESGEEILKKSIIKKGKRYGDLDKPFIICINTLDYETSNTFSINNAIWGSEAISYSLDPNNRNIKRIRKPNGLFFTKRPRLKKLSGTLFTNANPFNINNIEHFLFKNPFSENPLNFDELGFEYEFLDGTQVKKIEGTKLMDILN